MHVSPSADVNHDNDRGIIFFLLSLSLSFSYNPLLLLSLVIEYEATSEFGMATTLLRPSIMNVGMGMGGSALLRGRTISPTTIRNFSGVTVTGIGRSIASTRTTIIPSNPKLISSNDHRNLRTQSRSYSVQNPGATNPTSIPSQQHPTTSSSSSNSNSNSGPEGEPQPTGAYAKFKLLAKKYGWYAIGMYSILSAFDFSLSFLVVHSLGAERIEPLISTSLRTYRTWRHGPEETRRLEEEDKVRREEVKNEQKKNGGYWGSRMFWAEILLAYTIHKTLLLPFRAGLTVAWTPKVVNWLRARGWAGKVSRSSILNPQSSDHLTIYTITLYTLYTPSHPTIPGHIVLSRCTRMWDDWNAQPKIQTRG